MEFINRLKQWAYKEPLKRVDYIKRVSALFCVYFFIFFLVAFVLNERFYIVHMGYYVYTAFMIFLVWKLMERRAINIGLRKRTLAIIMLVLELLYAVLAWHDFSKPLNTLFYIDKTHGMTLHVNFDGWESIILYVSILLAILPANLIKKKD